jgi:beta-lactamase regulating signal transducer with metallopeptidase domain
MDPWINWLVAVTNKGAVWLFLWSWQALALLACVWLGVKLTRLKSPALRHRIWLLGLIAVAAFPLWPLLLEWLGAPPPSSRPLPPAVEIPISIITVATPKADQIVTTDSTARTLTIPAIAQSCIFLAWLVGAMISLARVAYNGARLGRIRTRAVPVTLAELGIDESECEMLMPAGKRLALSNETNSPILVGVLHPLILLPMDLASWTDAAQRRAMVLHESAHIARRDHYANLFQALLSAIFYFHPLVRYACYQLNMNEEMACDDQVISSGTQTETYAEIILKAAERNLRTGGAHQPALFSSRKVLEKRIEMIMNTDRGRMVARSWRYLLLPAALITCLAWLLVPGRMARTTQFEYLEGKMANPMQFEYPSGNDEEILKALVRKLAETIPQQDNSMDQYLSPKDCRETERFGKPMSEIIKEFYEHGNTITKIDVEDIRVNLSPLDHKRGVSFQTTIYIRPQGGDQEISVFRRYWVNFQKLNGIWQGSRNAEHLSSKLRDTIMSWLMPPPTLPEMTGAQDNKFQSDREAVYTLLRELADAMLRRNLSFFERTLTDDYVGVHHTSLNSFNKTQQIAAILKLRSFG